MIVTTSVESSAHCANESAPSGCENDSSSKTFADAAFGSAPPRSVARSKVTVSVSPPPKVASPLSKSSATNCVMIGPRVLP
jgi:hypothetical protein